MSRKIIIAITGARGSIYAKRLIDQLSNSATIPEACGVVFFSSPSFATRGSKQVVCDDSCIFHVISN